VEGIVSSFVGCGGEKWTCLAAVVKRLSNAVARGALSLLVGIVSSLCYRHLMSRLEKVVMEMRCMTLELADILATRSRQK
jgi:biopolymer transport protein ExbB/TolQ